MIEVLTVPLWSLAAYRDYQTRSVSNRLLGLLLFISILISILRVLQHDIHLLEILISVLVFSTVGLFLYSKDYLAGADAKAFIVLGFSFPTLTAPILLLTSIIGAIYTRYTITKTIPFLVPLFVAICLSLLWGVLVA